MERQLIEVVHCSERKYWRGVLSSCGKKHLFMVAVFRRGRRNTSTGARLKSQHFMQWGNFTVNRRGLRSLTMVTTSHNICADSLADDERRAFGEITGKWICCIRYCILQMRSSLRTTMSVFAIVRQSSAAWNDFRLTRRLGGCHTFCASQTIAQKMLADDERRAFGETIGNRICCIRCCILQMRSALR